MRRANWALWIVVIILMASGHPNGATKTPFGTPLVLTQMMDQGTFFNSSTGYSGSATVVGNTARVSVDLDTGDDWPAPVPPAYPTPVAALMVADKLGASSFQELWDTSGRDWQCVANTPLKVTVGYSYSITNGGWGNISAAIQLNNGGPYDSLTLQNSQPVTHEGSGLETSITVPFGALHFVGGNLHMSGPAIENQGPLHYEGVLTIHSVTFDFPEGVGCPVTPIVGWGASYGMNWDKRVGGDQLLDADGPYQFNHWWLFNLYNRSGRSLPAPKITAQLDGTLAGLQAGMSPPDPNITMTQTAVGAEWSMSQLAASGNGSGMQGTLSTTSTTPPISDWYALGFDATRQLSGGRHVAGGATAEPRTFTMTVTARDTTLSDIGTSIDLSGGASNPNPGPVSTANVACNGPGYLFMNSNSQVFWKIGEINYPPLQYNVPYTLTCTLNLTNRAASPALYTPLVISSGRRMGESIMGLGSVSYASLIEPTDPVDRLGGAVTFQTGAPDVLGSLQVIFTRTAILSEVNTYDDSVPPMTTAAVSPAPISSWNNGPVSVTLNATDFGGSGVKQIFYWLQDPGSPSPPPPTVVAGDTVTLAISRNTTLIYYAQDNAGNMELGKALPIRIDTVAPTATAGSPVPSLTDSQGQLWWNANTVMVGINANDCVPNIPCSMVRTIWYSLAGAQSGPLTSAPGIFINVPVSVEGTTTVTYYAEDNAGNTSLPRTFVVNLDRTKPATSANVSPTPSPSPNGNWNNSPVTVTLKATDAGGTGVRQIWYWLSYPGSPTPQPPTAAPGDALTLTLASTATVFYYAQDNAGNTEAGKSVFVQVDTTPPTASAGASPGPVFTDPQGQKWWKATGVTVTINAGDCAVPNTPCSRVRQIWYSVAGAHTVALTSAPGVTVSGTITNEGTTTVTYYAEDNAGNLSIPQTFVVNIDRTAPVINAVVASPAVLWPANHKMVPITLAVTTSDNVTPVPICRVASVTSNEPLNGSGDGNTAVDFMFSGVGLDLSLRAERAGPLADRVYTVAVVCRDGAGNVSLPKTVAIVVPHDKGK